MIFVYFVSHLNTVVVVVGNNFSTIQIFSIHLDHKPKNKYNITKMFVSKYYEMVKHWLMFPGSCLFNIHTTFSYIKFSTGGTSARLLGREALESHSTKMILPWWSQCKQSTMQTTYNRIKLNVDFYLFTILY